MAWDFTVTDTKGYLQVQTQVDALIVGALAEGGKTSHELMALMYQAHIAKANSESRLDLAYSPLGAIFRSAVNSLRLRKIIYDSGDLALPYEKPFRYFRREMQPTGGA